MANEDIRIFKLPMEKIIERNNLIENYTAEQAIMNGELVPILSSQLTGKIQDFYKENSLDGLEVRDAIINIVVPNASGSQTAKVARAYGELARMGFNFNGRHYVRLCAGSGQLRNNTITFVWDAIHDYITEALYCGITPEELGESFSVSKWNAYVGLSESGMRFLTAYPRVCVISDYEEIKPHFPIDYIETECSGGRKNKRVNKTISKHFYDDPEMAFAPLNSFDGQGLADPEWMRQVAKELGYLTEDRGYTPSEYIVRAPWCKGLVVAFDFKQYCREHGVTILQDVYGQECNIEEIDILLSTSQFKMWKAYGKHGGWQYHQESMKRHNLRWGVVIANKERDDDYRALNYQYVQALDLEDEDIGRLCERTENMLTNLCSGHIETVYRTLAGCSDEQDYGADSAEPSKATASLLQRAITHNYELLQDAYIQELIYREAEAKFNGAKIGKLLCRGGYSFIVSDPVGQMQHVIKNHAVDGNHDMEVTGLIPANTIYSAYWNNVCPTPEQVVLMRSPLIDPSEVTVCGLVRTPEMDKWYSHIKSGLVLSIHDLNTLALQNCDFDGDRCFSSNDPILIKGAQENPVPILYPSAGAQLKGAISFESMVEADIRGLNSAVGSLSNQATGLYALRDKYPKHSPEYEELTRRIKVVSELVGVEIDKIKTGIPPQKPSAWSRERMPYEQFCSTDSGRTVKAPACSPEEQERIHRHNALIPDSKPYFMRYIYETLNRDLTKYDTAFDSVCKYNDGIRLAELLNADYDSLDKAAKETVDRYYKCFPAIDSPCIMNKICRRFEHLQAGLKRHKSSVNMLPDFITLQEFEDDVLTRIAEIVDLFQRQKRFIVRTNNTVRAESNKQLAKESKERLTALHTHIREQVLALVEGDVQAAYNYLVELVNRKQCSESTVWAILDELILLVIPQKIYQKEAAA